MLGTTALAIRVLDAQQEDTPVMPRQQGIEQGGAGIAQVHLSRGAGRETGFDGGLAHAGGIIAYMRFQVPDTRFPDRHQ
ncbi:hypothetical protein TspCOW1_10670 [Thiohalobacter sp. COW1]|nr:hypothetical protein TspCOW1_10670 [Thiohalobacter sp. COW1]